MVQPLLELALSIFHITRQFNITLPMNWISRDYNENARLACRQELDRSSPLSRTTSYRLSHVVQSQRHCHLSSLEISPLLV